MMIADSLSGIPMTQGPDVKIEKNAKVEEPRAIEESDKGDSSQLDMEKQSLSKRMSFENMNDADPELRPYTATGRSSTMVLPDENPAGEYETIDLVV